VIARALADAPTSFLSTEGHGVSHGLRQMRLLFVEAISAALMLEGKASLLRLLQEIPLGEAEEAAVEDGVAAYEKYC
jgi:hypothetical protein